MPGVLTVSLATEGQLAVVVGGGAVAERKVEALLGAGARVRVISPALTPGLAALAGAGRVETVARGWAPGDGTDALLVVAATGVAAVDAAVAAEAGQAGQLVNVAGQPGLGNVHFTAEIRRGPLRVAVASDGSAPGLVRRLRGELERLIGPEWGEAAEVIREGRTKLRTVSGLTPSDRARLLEELMEKALRSEDLQEG